MHIRNNKQGQYYTFEHLKRRPNLIKKIDLQFNNYIIT